MLESGAPERLEGGFRGATGRGTFGTSPAPGISERRSMPTDELGSDTETGTERSATMGAIPGGCDPIGATVGRHTGGDTG